MLIRDIHFSLSDCRKLTFTENSRINTALCPLCHPPTSSTDLCPTVRLVYKHRAPLCTSSTASVQDVPRAPEPHHTSSSPLPRGRVVSWAQASNSEIRAFSGLAWIDLSTNVRKEKQAGPSLAPAVLRLETKYVQRISTNSDIYIFKNTT